MKLVFISDTHTLHKDLIIPECDLLISCGDYSNVGKYSEVISFHAWLNKQNAKHIISLQGNHELGVENNWSISKSLAKESCPRVNFIDEGLVEIEGLKVWCSSVTPEFNKWAWNRARGAEIKKHWDLIPNDLDILVTHGPPAGILDYFPEFGLLKNVGCQDLLEAVYRAKPQIHAFGHIHHCGGKTHLESGTTFINAAVCNEQYKPINPIVTLQVAF